jgi:hypothetical protein
LRQAAILREEEIFLLLRWLVPKGMGRIPWVVHSDGSGGASLWEPGTLARGGGQTPTTSLLLVQDVFDEDWECTVARDPMDLDQVLARGEKESVCVIFERGRSSRICMTPLRRTSSPMRREESTPSPVVGDDGGVINVVKYCSLKGYTILSTACATMLPSTATT